MSSALSDRSIRGRRLIAEGIGTFFLVLIGPGTAMVNAFTGGAVGHVGVALAFAFVVIAMIYALGHLSGAHINPAVTLAFWSVRRLPAAEVVPYVAAQCAGAALASLTLLGVLGPVGQLGATLPNIAPEKAFGLEWLLSFALMFVIMAVATDECVPAGFAALAVGLTVGFCALMGGPLTGASMNPARSFGPAIVGGLWTAHWVYWVAPVTGMILAARVYDGLRRAGPAAQLAEEVPLGVEGPTAPAAPFT
jgi:MIP family channel proteins